MQALFVTTLTIVVGYIILNVLLEDSSTELVRFLAYLDVPEAHARAWYWRWIGNNKVIVMAIGYLMLFCVFFYIALGKLEDYLRQVEKGIHNITEESQEAIEMIEELKPIEERLTQIKKTLRKRKQQAQEAEQKKNDLVVYLAHDLKTPLTSVIGYLTLLEETPELSTELRAKYIGVALDKAYRLELLINEFFDITRMNYHAVSACKLPVNLTILLIQIINEFYPAMEDKNITVIQEIEPELILYADAEKLARMFDNLFRNAVNYSYNDSEIVCNARKGNDCILISIKNKGEQVPLEKLERIFDKFYRLDSARQSVTGGAGLGLAITKQIVELHNGTIEAVCIDGIMEFKIVFPL